MTTPEFLDLLAEIRDQFDWTLSADTGHRDERRTRSRFHLRATHGSLASVTLGPLRAVAFTRTGNLPDTWTEAAVVLGIKIPEAAAIAAAANDRTWVGKDGQRVPGTELLDLRQCLLAAVGMISSGSAVAV